MMWKSLVSIPGIESSLCLRLFNISSFSPSIPAGRAGQAGAQRNQNRANSIFQAYPCERHKAALQKKSYF